MPKLVCALSPFASLFSILVIFLHHVRSNLQAVSRLLRLPRPMHSSYPLLPLHLYLHSIALHLSKLDLLLPKAHLMPNHHA